MKRDFPRVPLTSDRKLFKRLVKVGHGLMSLHMMKSTLRSIAAFPVIGSNEAHKVKGEVRAAAIQEPKGTGLDQRSAGADN
ncbi:MAG: hypothetical protein FWH15_00675 [Betaproteobacteria bacterium]|nr:hypothetical protein [Betaproteobacteria bacterium]